MKIKEAREAAGYTQESLNLKINGITKCSLRHLQNIEYGTVIPTVTLALVISELLQVDPRAIDEWKYAKRQS